MFVCVCVFVAYRADSNISLVIQMTKNRQDTPGEEQNYISSTKLQDHSKAIVINTVSYCYKNVQTFSSKFPGTD